MSNLPARRDAQSDTWTWETPRERPPDGRGPPWRPILVIIAALGLIGGGSALLLLADDDEGSDGEVARSATPTRTTAGPSRTAAAATASPQDGSVQLFAWSPERGRWISGDLRGDDASYREGDSIPFVMGLDAAAAGRLYNVTVRYKCGTEGGEVFDFLAAPSEADEGAVLVAPGPARERPDTTIPIPDDPSITFDDNAIQKFKLWGATFQQSPQGPLPPAACRDVKEFRMSVVAHGPDVFLVWAGHLASAGDWGVGRGASAQDEVASMEVAVTGFAGAEVNIAPDVVEP